MAEQKTKPTTVSVEDYINKIESETVRDDCRSLIRMMQKVTGAPPVMWGPAIIGFDKYHYKYASGHEGEAALAAFAPRKGNITVYAYNQSKSLMKKLGKHKAKGVCIHFKRLSDIDLDVLEQVVRDSVKDTRKQFPS